MTINELREKRAQQWEAAKNFLNSHRTEKGTLTAEDDASYTAMEQEIADLGKEIARMERQEALDAELAKPVNKPITAKPMSGMSMKEDEKMGRASDDYKKNFWNVMRTKAPMIGSVVSAVSDVASTIRSYLHFSVPDEGPLTDYESWMPDFMQGLAKGIESNKGLLTKAMSDVANTLNMDGVLPDMSASINANVSGRSDGTEGGNVTLNQPILLDGKTLTTVVSQIQYSQGRASLRNLGTA